MDTRPNPRRPWGKRQAGQRGAATSSTRRPGRSARAGTPDGSGAALRTRRLAAAGQRVTSGLRHAASHPAVDPGAWTREARESLARVRATRRVPGLRTIKVAAATVLAYLAAVPLPGNEPPVVAALTALLVVQATLYQTLRSGWQRVGSVFAGVLIAVLFADVTGLTWWSLGITVVAALILGQRLKLGEQAIEVPISAMLVLTVASHAQIGLNRVYETLVGAAVGVLVSFVAPPVYVQPAGDAIGVLADEISRVLHTAADGLRPGWNARAAMDALRRARELERPVERARKALNRAEESLRLNPRRVYASHVPDTLRSGLTALEYAAINVRVTCRALFDRAGAVSNRAARDRDVPGLMADALAAAAEAVAAFGQLVAPDVAGPRRDEAELRWALVRAQSARDAASRAMSVDPRTEPEIWRLNGAILAHVDRLLAEIDPDAEEAARAVRRPESVPSPTTRLRRRTVSMLRVGGLRADRRPARSR